jgi:hypothetical protein
MCSTDKTECQRKSMDYVWNCYSDDIMTCQPFVGLRNGVSRHRPVNNSRPNTRCAAVGEAVFAPCRAVPSRTATSAATQQAAMTSHGSTLASEATPCKHSDLTQQR